MQSTLAALNSSVSVEPQKSLVLLVENFTKNTSVPVKILVFVVVWPGCECCSTACN